MLDIHPKIILWIENFLSNRTQTVVVDGYVSIIDYQAKCHTPEYHIGIDLILPCQDVV